MESRFGIVISHLNSMDVVLRLSLTGRAICCPYQPEEMVSMVRILKTGLNMNGTDGLLLVRWVNIWHHWMATSRCFSIDLSSEVNVLLIRISLIANTQRTSQYQGLSFRVLSILIGKEHQSR